MKLKKIQWLFILPSILLIQCNNSQKNGTNQQQEEINIDVSDEIEVLFDESEGEASLTKNIYILFDASGSMSESCANEVKIAGAKQAIIQYIEKIPRDYNLGLLIFGTPTESGIEEMVTLGANNHQQIIASIENVFPQKRTPLADATAFGVEKLVEQYKKQLGYGEYRLVIVTDGMANEPEKFESSLQEASRYSFIAIYGIGLCIDGFHTLKDYSLSYTDANDYEQLGTALEKTIGELQDFDPTEFN